MGSLLPGLIKIGFESDLPVKKTLYSLATSFHWQAGMGWHAFSLWLRLLTGGRTRKALTWTKSSC